MKHDMKSFYDGTKPYQPWAVTTMTRYKRKLFNFANGAEAFMFISFTFFVGFAVGLIVAYLLGG